MGEGTFSPEVFAKVFTTAFVQAFREACTTTAPSPPSQVKVQRISDDEWMAREAAVLATTKFPDLYRDLADCLIAENRTGRASLSRIVGALLEPLLKVEQGTTAERFEYGITQAIGRGAPNANYVKRAASGYTPGKASTTRGAITAADLNAYADHLESNTLALEA